MTDITTDAVDVPEPDEVLGTPPRDTSAYDPGDDPALADQPPALGEDPRYDPGGYGTQPDLDALDEDHR